MEKLTTRWDLPPEAKVKPDTTRKKLRAIRDRKFLAVLHQHVYEPLPPDDIRATGKLPEPKRIRPPNPELFGQPRPREIA